MGALARALDKRRTIGDGAAGASVVVALRGGLGALVKRSAGRRLVTIVTQADADQPARGLVGWLEKRQARRSLVLVVPDRPVGVAIALRWGISPERFRLAEDLDIDAGKALPASGTGRPWHSNR